MQKKMALKIVKRSFWVAVISVSFLWSTMKILIFIWPLRNSQKTMWIFSILVGYGKFCRKAHCQNFLQTRPKKIEYLIFYFQMFSARRFILNSVKQSRLIFVHRGVSVDSQSIINYVDKCVVGQSGLLGFAKLAEIQRSCSELGKCLTDQAELAAMLEDQAGVYIP